MNAEPISFRSAPYIDLLSEKYGGQALSCSDDFFAEKDNLCKTSEPIFIDDKYTERGKWMDGWESRRRRDGGYDWAILRLGIPGTVKTVNVDTTHFRGNAPASVSIDACFETDEPGAHTKWYEILSDTAVNPNSHNLIDVNDDRPWTHIRLNIYPDGGVARLRVYGEPFVDWNAFLPGELIDLAASVNGASALACSDMFFSSIDNLLAPGRGKNMGDGWETKRRRGPGYDWAIIRLAKPGQLHRVEIDTNHFKGNFPDTFSLEFCNATDEEVQNQQAEWFQAIPQTKLYASRQHYFSLASSVSCQSYTHARLNIYPDGGVSRMRLLGYPE